MGEVRGRIVVEMAAAIAVRIARHGARAAICLGWRGLVRSHRRCCGGGVGGRAGLVVVGVEVLHLRDVALLWLLLDFDFVARGVVPAGHWW